MATLTEKQIALISEDLHAQGITFDPLREELLDHLICGIKAPPSQMR